MCHTGMSVWNGNLGTDRTTTNAPSVRKQLGPKNSNLNEGRQVKNGRERRETEWAGHVERMVGDRLPKRAAELR